MIRRILLFAVVPLFVMYIMVAASITFAEEAPPKASVDGKYSDLIQVMNCPKDRGAYGEFRDDGWWDGGQWCGQTGKAGYWVWVTPNWYVWSDKK